ncbi:MAG: hypothetical protein JWP97_3580 [Labilithrix sp.]|nr:hypothetical protein [Labilithrix sp.]
MSDPNKPELPSHPNDPSSPREIENPGDPGFPVLVPPEPAVLPNQTSPQPFTPDVPDETQTNERTRAN